MRVEEGGGKGKKGANQKPRSSSGQTMKKTPQAAERLTQSK